jgi:nitrate/nitrite-specific signal transduction histidine kinase
MTSQLSGFIDELEQRVARRTAELERRVVHLQVAAEVAQEASEIRNLEKLLEHTVT